MNAPPVIIVMGVSGAGKTTIAEALSQTLLWPFQEGDALHPEANIEKMHAGLPLTDEDRAPWLQAVKTWIDLRVAACGPGLITCSGLKRCYRAYLVAGRPNVRLLYLKADPSLLKARLAARTGHFMPASQLASQLATLEEPVPGENPIIVDVAGDTRQTIQCALAALRPG